MEQFKKKLPARLRTALETNPNKPIAAACCEDECYENDGTHELMKKASGKGYGAGCGMVPMKHESHMEIKHQEYNR